MPLLVKAAGEGVPAVQAAKRLGLDGVVLVSASTRRVVDLAECLTPRVRARASTEGEDAPLHGAARRLRRKRCSGPSKAAE